MADVLGGKGANLAEMTAIGVPVPPGFTVSTRVCSAFLRDHQLPSSLESEVRAAMQHLEHATARGFGDATNPLLVSIRSGAPVSMPGMMDTILNLGLNDDTVLGLAQRSGNAQFAYDSYRRFIQMYGTVVFGPHEADAGTDPFEAVLDRVKRKHGVSRDIDLDVEAFQGLVREFRGIVERRSGAPFPTEPWTQLWGAVEAVFQSWQTRRAVDYRKVHRIPDQLGTAVNVVAMVYGNLGNDSGTGVAFTRDPSTGERRLYGEFLLNAQGEDVVSGTRDPEPIERMADYFPDALRELQQTAERLENHFRDAQDIEFTVQRGTLYLLQTRDAKRTTRAAVRIAVDMVDEGFIDREEAVRRIPATQLDQLLHPTVDPDAAATLLATGLPASPGAATGRIVFDADRAVALAESGDSVVLVRRETSPDDFHGMVAAEAILTARGGMTSHAAVVARGMGKACITGCKQLDIDETNKSLQIDGRALSEGQWLTVDGSSGRVLLGRVPLVTANVSDEFNHLMSWVDELRTLRVRTNADTPEDARRAREFGAEGIGLCRTEHMFFRDDRILAVREMIVATDLEGRRRALLKLLPMQREDFAEIFRVMDGLPVTIRLLDPPLHEFLPQTQAEVVALADRLDVPHERLRRAIDLVTEANPMLGHRGCRLGITFPEITEMQAEALFEAACEVARQGIAVYPEIMIPLVAHVEELERQSAIVRGIAERVFSDRGQRIGYLLGTMIELPRAALTAGELARAADFFSFGTNDLTQTTFGLSRDDAGRFLPYYIESGILADDPFQTLDQDGVGQLVHQAIERGRARNPRLKIGVCGEHGGDPRSVTFFHREGIDYVSCSPFRVPVAQLAAAQAALPEVESRRSGG